jgi:hypothetical protein
MTVLSVVHYWQSCERERLQHTEVLRQKNNDRPITPITQIQSTAVYLTLICRIPRIVCMFDKP